MSEIAEQKILDNKEIMLEAAGLYLKLIEHAANNGWKDLFNLVDIRKAGNRDWISQKWYNEEILAPIRKKILKLPIVETENGQMCSMLDADGNHNIYFPSHSKTEVRDKIWDLEYPLFPDKLPAKKDIHAWYRVVWDECFINTLEALTLYIHKKENIVNLSSGLEKDESAAYDWLNQYYDLLNFEDAFITEIINEKYAVIPNQLGVFKKRTTLTIDNDIEEELKNVLEMLGVDIRSQLRSNRINTKSAYTDQRDRAIMYSSKDQSNVIDSINKILESTHTAAGMAVSYLLGLFADDPSFPVKRERIYQFCRRLLKSEMPEKKIIKKWDEKIWSFCDPARLGRLTSIISETKDIKQLKVLIDSAQLDETFTWLDDFVSFLNTESYEKLVNDKKSPILPNQNGIYKTKDELFLDDGEIDEELKDIAASLGYDIRDELLDKRIFLKLPDNRVRNQEAVADEISKLVKPLFAEFPRSPETRQIFKTLYLWFSENRETAQNIFSDLYKNKHKLYDDDEIAENMKKAEDLDDLLNSTGMSIE
ncbi:MAG: hypothetical protein ACK5XN_16485, partial [Bacteroidota bacterium]